MDCPFSRRKLGSQQWNCLLRNTLATVQLALWGREVGSGKRELHWNLGFCLGLKRQVSAKEGRSSPGMEVKGLSGKDIGVGIMVLY